MDNVDEAARRYSEVTISLIPNIKINKGEYRLLLSDEERKQFLRTGDLGPASKLADTMTIGNAGMPNSSFGSSPELELDNILESSTSPTPTTARPRNQPRRDFTPEVGN